MDQRSCPRINAVGMKIDISDKIGFSAGTLKDVSRFGVCILGISLELQTENKSVTAVLSVDGKRFTLQLRPQWQKQYGPTMVTGAIIADAPSDWTDMIMQLELQDEEAWSLIH